MRSRAALILFGVAAVAVVIAVVLRSGDETPTAQGAANSTTTTETTQPEQAPSSATQTTVVETTATTGVPATTLAPGATVCDPFRAVEVLGVVVNPDIVEASGLAQGRLNEGVLWTHNDSRDGPRLYALGFDGSDLGTFEIGGALAFDWEDMAVGPGPQANVPYLYVGDIGDNFGIRNGLVTVYRVPEPDTPPGNGLIPNAVPLPLRYSDGSSPNAEALFVDPIAGDLFIVTRDRELTRVYRAQGAGDGATTMPLDLVAEVDLGGEGVTAADVSWDGSVIGLRGEEAIWMFHRPQGTSVTEALEGEACRAPSPDERQGEAIAFVSDGSILTIAEGSNPALNRVGRDG